MKVLFLDIDGVANTHRPWPNGFCGLDTDKISLLSDIVAATQCKIVLASAWRYMLLKGAMTLDGFRYLLLIHGASREFAEGIIDWLPADRNLLDTNDRGKLARDWLDTHPEVSHVVALDDGAVGPSGIWSDLGYGEAGVAAVHPKSDVGLTAKDAHLVITLLNGETASCPGKQEPVISSCS